MATAPPPPWDLTLYTREYTIAEPSRDDAARAWDRFLPRRPLLYLPDRPPHGDCDARIDHGRRLWRHNELVAFDIVVEKRTQTLLQHQRAVLDHWRRAATCIQAHARGLVARRRVQRLRQQLLDAAIATARARELAALRQRQLYAVIRIQTVYHRHCDHVHFVFACRQRVQRFVRVYIFRWQRHRAASVLQRAYRQFRRRVALAAALKSLLRMLRRSRQRAALEAAAAAFHDSRRQVRDRERERQWRREPAAMAMARRVHARKSELLFLPRLAPSRAVVVPVKTQSQSTLPRIRQRVLL